MKHLYFVRHGLSEMNKRNIFSGRTETPLADEGVAQAVAAGKQLRGKHIDLIVASPITRALHTAQLIADEIGYDPDKIVTSDYFSERDFGPLEGTPYQPNATLDDVAGVEHSRELVARVKKGADFLRQQEAETILVVAHGATGRALRHLVQPDTPFHGSDKFANAEVHKLL